MRLVELAVVLEAPEILLEQVRAWAQRDEDPADDGGQAAAEVQRFPVLASCGKRIRLFILRILHVRMSTNTLCSRCDYTIG